MDKFLEVLSNSQRGLTSVGGQLFDFSAHRMFPFFIQCKTVWLVRWLKPKKLSPFSSARKAGELDNMATDSLAWIGNVGSVSKRFSVLVTGLWEKSWEAIRTFAFIKLSCDSDIQRLLIIRACYKISEKKNKNFRNEDFCFSPNFPNSPNVSIFCFRRKCVGLVWRLKLKIILLFQGQAREGCRITWLQIVWFGW